MVLLHLHCAVEFELFRKVGFETPAMEEELDAAEELVHGDSR
jgi:hypothetical protein